MDRQDTDHEIKSYKIGGMDKKGYVSLDSVLTI